MAGPSTSSVRWGLALAGVAAGWWMLSRARRRARYSLAGKVVLIAGSSRGLGLQLAREIGARGAKVVICGRDAAALDRASEDLQSRGVRVLAATVDLTCADEVDRLVDAVRQVWGPVEVLICNAGRIEVGPLEHVTEDDHRGDMALHFWAPLRLMNAVVPEMKRARRGQLVNIASLGGSVPIPHMVPYVASKHALVGLSRGYRVELARHGITVTTVHPGLIRTGSSINAQFKGRHKAEYTWFGLGEALPGTAVSAPRAARRIRKAIESGRTELVIGWPAKVAMTMQAVAPRFMEWLLAGVARVMPGPREGVTEVRRGWQSESLLTRSPLFAPHRRAERMLNQRTREFLRGRG